MIKTWAIALFAWMAFAIPTFADQPHADDICYQDGAAITVTGTARKMPLANGGVSEVWLLMLDRQLCVLGAGDAALSPAKNVVSLQIIGQRPPADDRIELSGHLATISVTQRYPGPTAIVVTSGRRLSANLVPRSPAIQTFDAKKVAELLDQQEETTRTSNMKPTDSSNTWALVVIIFFLYFLPTTVASWRGHHNKDAIGVLNVFLGWTFIGWVAALVWACTNNTRQWS